MKIKNTPAKKRLPPPKSKNNDVWMPPDPSMCISTSEYDAGHLDKTITNPINSYTSWQPLEEVIVGTCFPGDYFDYIEDKKVSNQLAQILHQTKEDFDNLANVLKTFGAHVLRPTIADKEGFNEMRLMVGEPEAPPLTPRDSQITLGDKLLVCSPDAELQTIIDNYDNFCPGSVIDPFNRVWTADNVLSGANASCIVRVGKDIFVDESEWLRKDHMEWIRDNVLGDQYNIHTAITEGHGDSVFAILKPGVILSTYHADDLNLEDEFPGWDILKLLDPSIIQAQKMGQFKEEHFNGRWYVPEQNPSAEFANYVDTYLSKWTGEAAETVFDVNCLVLDEEHVVFSAYNKEVWEFCKKHNIEPIISEIRHKYFWDTGISCSTQDIRRKGGLEQYL